MGERASERVVSSSRTSSDCKLHVAETNDRFALLTFLLCQMPVTYMYSDGSTGDDGVDRPLLKREWEECFWHNLF